MGTRLFVLALCLLVPPPAAAGEVEAETALPKNTWLSHLYEARYGDDGFELLSELCAYNRLRLDGFEDCDVLAAEQRVLLPPREVLLALRGDAVGRAPDSLIADLPANLRPTADRFATCAAVQEQVPRSERYDRWGVALVLFALGAGIPEDDVAKLATAPDLDCRTFIDTVLRPVPEPTGWYLPDGSIVIEENL